MNIPIKIAGIGFKVPETVITNDDLTKILDTSDEWIKTRTGIEQRHVLSGNETAVQMGIEAGKKALAKSNIKAEDIDYIIAAASFGTHIYPSTACEIQRAISKKSGTFDPRHPDTCGADGDPAGRYDDGRALRRWRTGSGQLC